MHDTPAGRRIARRYNKGKSPSAMNAGILFSLLFLVSAVATGVIVVSTMNSQTRTSVTTSTTISPTPPASPTAPAAPGGSADRGEPSRVYSMTPTPDAILDGLDVALLADFRAPYDPALATDLQQIETRLRNAGVRTATSLFTEEPDEADAALLAQLLALRGQADLTDDGLGSDLQSLLKQDDDLDAIWWVGPADHGRYQHLLVADSGITRFDDTEPRLNQIGDALLTKTGFAITDTVETASP